jgi:hypothetical protein
LEFKGGGHMYKKNLFKKSLIVGTIVLFIGAGAATGINGKINRNDIDKKTSNILSNQNVCLLNFHIFDKTKEKQNNVNLPIEAAKNIYNKLEELKHMIIYEPRNDETQNLKIEFVDLLDTYGLIPAGLTKDYLLSLLNPLWLKNNLGKIILKNILIPHPSAFAGARFCSIASAGYSGAIFPLFLLPRPRGIAIWLTAGGTTSVGELAVARGFVAVGPQVGTMFGFIGIGLTFAFPEESVYGFIGYAVSVRVFAENVQYIP